ncbi:MAG: AmmeMemoRadiSam system protein B [Proteobacteria bacterium]|nr:AmmeMemoRadiSam system protein B [Pseudomonadota bacterium]
MRNPAVAGFFYPDDEKELLRVVDDCLGTAEGSPSKACAVVSPHAGYIYSGKVAGEVIGQVEVPNRVVVLGPKHRHAGIPAAVSPPGTWRFPFGTVPIDEELSTSIVDQTSADFDESAHREEHSLEVQVPFLWRRNPRLKLTAVALGMHGQEKLEEFGRGLARAIKNSGEPVLIVASTDMSHHIPEEEARRLDDLAVQRVLDMDPAGLFETVMNNNISMCGVVPTTVALWAAKNLGAAEASLIRYTTSGDVSGDRFQVVGYAGLTIY